MLKVEAKKQMTSRSRLPRLVVFGDPAKGPVAQAIADFLPFVQGKADVVASCDIHKCTPEILARSDFAIVFGGDGSIIAAARSLSKAGIPVVGVNLGKLGFLAEFSLRQLQDSFDDIISGKAPVEKRMMLGCKAYESTDRNTEKFSSTAVNDVYVTAGPPFRMIELKISVDDQPLAGCVSDGLIVSTPTGSTAYNLSAGGPILAGAMEAMVITPICPHSLSFRPIVIDAASTIEIFCTRVNRGTTVSIDGQIPLPLAEGNVVTIQKDQSTFLIVNNPARSRWDTLATKLSWAEKPRYGRESG